MRQILFPFKNHSKLIGLIFIHFIFIFIISTFSTPSFSMKDEEEGACAPVYQLDPLLARDARSNNLRESKNDLDALDDKFEAIRDCDPNTGSCAYKALRTHVYVETGQDPGTDGIKSALEKAEQSQPQDGELVKKRLERRFQAHAAGTTAERQVIERKLYDVEARFYLGMVADEYKDELLVIDVTDEVGNPSKILNEFQGMRANDTALLRLYADFGSGNVRHTLVIIKNSSGGFDLVDLTNRSTHLISSRGQYIKSIPDAIQELQRAGIDNVEFFEYTNANNGKRFSYSFQKSYTRLMRLHRRSF